jgi:hypothetical protein
MSHLLLCQVPTRDDLICFIEDEFAAYHADVVALKIVDDVFILT